MITTPIGVTQESATVRKESLTGQVSGTAPRIFGADSVAQETGQIQEQASTAPRDQVDVSPEALVLGTQGGAEREMTPDEALIERLERAIADIEARTTALQFQIDRENGEMIVSIVDKASGEVIRQIPPEAMRNLHQNLEELRGLLIKETT